MHTFRESRSDPTAPSTTDYAGRSLPMGLERRQFLGAAIALAVAAASDSAFGQALDRSKPLGGMPFALPSLPYPYDSLEACIDAQTVELHHDKHHAAYVNNLNEAAKAVPQIASQPMELTLANLVELPEELRSIVRNNMGGHANHTMYWDVMGGKGGKPQGDVLSAIDRDLGGIEKLRADFDAAGMRVFGSGWVFVTVSRDGKLALESRPNQDSPLMDGKRVLFGNDVWEHAYYLRYQNRRTDYLHAWWSVVNWSRISDRYAAARAGTLTI